ncbi:MAG: hypothetical protein JNJ88_15780 [Planctomycetes bacterium]|nr:hypothetical protein [Planctomycetota bacterium]
MPHATASLASLVLLGLSLAPARYGPPLLCFEFEIGQAASIDESTITAADLIPKTLASLDASQDPLVHVETLRRATMAGMRLDREGAGGEVRLRYKLAHQLYDRALRAQLAGGSSAMPLLDIGYFVEAMNQSYGRADVSGLPYLDKVAEINPQDPTVHLVLAASWFMKDTSLFGKGGHERSRQEWGLAISLAPEGSLIRKAAVESAKYFLGEKTADALQKAPAVPPAPKK